jgi:hypothetical protein
MITRRAALRAPWDQRRDGAGGRMWPQCSRYHRADGSGSARSHASPGSHPRAGVITARGRGSGAHNCRRGCPAENGWHAQARARG